MSLLSFSPISSLPTLSFTNTTGGCVRRCGVRVSVYAHCVCADVFPSVLFIHSVRLQFNLLSLFLMELLNVSSWTFRRYVGYAMYFIVYTLAKNICVRASNQCFTFCLPSVYISFVLSHTFSLSPARSLLPHFQSYPSKVCTGICIARTNRSVYSLKCVKYSLQRSRTQIAWCITVSFKNRRLFAWLAC